MPRQTPLQSQMWSRFKLEQTDENRLISLAIRELLTEVGASGPVLDIGAGVGDIAWAAYPELPATLVDVLNFEQHQTSVHHVRRTLDFFKFSPGGVSFETVVMSHVLQYLDEDVPSLLARLDEIDPKFLITVLNEDSQLVNAAVGWLIDQGVQTNPEVPVPGFPSPRFRERSSRDVTGTFWAADFIELGHTLATLIIDAELTGDQPERFGEWLSCALPRPEFNLHQKVKLYVN